MIAIREGLLDEIRRHATRAYPRECCGALLGRDTAAGREVARLHPLDNRRDGDAARRRFLVTGEDHSRVEKAARERGLDIVGFYHSHPDHPARPSDFDREHALPWYSYVIIRVAGGRPAETTSWRLAEDRARFDTEPIRTTVAGASAPRAASGGGTGETRGDNENNRAGRRVGVPGRFTRTGITREEERWPSRS